MKRADIAVMEKDEVHAASFETEPWECAWADEARWFVRVIELEGRLVSIPQLSPDGMHWCDVDESLVINEPGLHSFSQADFGPYLRLRCSLEGEAGRVRLFIYLALKG